MGFYRKYAARRLAAVENGKGKDRASKQRRLSKECTVRKGTPDCRCDVLRLLLHSVDTSSSITRRSTRTYNPLAPEWLMQAMTAVSGVTCLGPDANVHGLILETLLRLREHET